MKALRIPLLLFALPAVLLAFAPARHAWFLLDRSALRGGEVWRLWSGHWAHFSGSHLLWNLVVLVAAGAWLERLRPGLLLRHTLFAAPLIGWALMACEPGLETYGGLSGLATGVVVLLGLHQLHEPRSPRLLWAAVLALVALKTTYDLTHADTLLVHYGAAPVRTSRIAHAAGALIGAACYVKGRIGCHRG